MLIHLKNFLNAIIQFAIKGKNKQVQIKGRLSSEH